MVLAASAHAHAADLTLDPTHTFARFEIDHFGATTHRGRFDRVQGTVFLDRISGAGHVDVAIEIGSVNTGTAAFDRQLLGPDLLDVERYAVARFVSERFDFSNGRVQEVQGIHGRTPDGRVADSSCSKNNSA